MEDLSMEELRKLIVKAMKELSPDNFDFTNDFAEELCDDYWRRAEKAPTEEEQRRLLVQQNILNITSNKTSKVRAIYIVNLNKHTIIAI